MVLDDHGLPDDALSNVITLEQLRELWVEASEARDSVSAALAILKNEPAPPASTRSTPIYDEAMDDESRTLFM